MTRKRSLLIAIFALAVSSARAICPYDANCINNPYTGRPYAPAPTPTSDLGKLAPSGLGSGLGSNGLGSGMIGSKGGLQGFDPDRK
jgi:hypothetical protein